MKIILLEAHFGGRITRKLEKTAEMFISQYFLLEINSEIARYHFDHEIHSFPCHRQLVTYWRYLATLR